MAYKVCSNCNEDNSENAAVCTSCSHTLLNAKLHGIPSDERNQTSSLYTSKKTLYPNSNTQSSLYANRGNGFCSKCSERLDEGALKCKYCGHMTVATPRPYGSGNPVYSYESNNSGAVALLYIATFFIPLVGLIVGGMYALDNDQEKSSTGKGLIVFGLIMIVLGIILWSVIS
ncbi:zinc ribbon domain-containing protein [Paenibacillus agricola]|uniref:DUF4190 domain-containing protein n=1 Tax=Paenibacillus agricola TaxID=2716264 RepID=A0ABX0JIA9_9BACL|nr:zinc ribbon domain-containing protein [Paenibacillus agricola]NHN35601.1 DUF4190 domain-containing protein [Paenibacillus agricola]